uniref:CRAL-TRIO domain-containing protein n=1 Tax=Prasinoderma singulare TaxID=676789 RepID=A0A7S3C4E0_9VIRI
MKAKKAARLAQIQAEKARLKSAAEQPGSGVELAKEAPPVKASPAPPKAKTKAGGVQLSTDADKIAAMTAAADKAREERGMQVERAVAAQAEASAKARAAASASSASSELSPLRMGDDEAAEKAERAAEARAKAAEEAAAAKAAEEVAAAKAAEEAAAAEAKAAEEAAAAEAKAAEEVAATEAKAAEEAATTSVAAPVAQEQAEKPLAEVGLEDDELPADGRDRALSNSEESQRLAAGRKAATARNLNVVRMPGLDSLRRPIVHVNVSVWPEDKASSDAAMADVAAALKPIVEAEYTLIFDMRNEQNAKSTGARMAFRLLSYYRALERPYRKNVKRIIILAPTRFTRFALAVLKPFLSGKSARKIQAVPTVGHLSALTNGELTSEHL